MLDRELRQNSIKGIKTSISGPTITHVMYADDIVLVSKATKRDAETISKILEKYSLWSGQLVNRSKSGIFSPSTLRDPPKGLSKIFSISRPLKEIPHTLVHRSSCPELHQKTLSISNQNWKPDLPDGEASVCLGQGEEHL